MSLIREVADNVESLFLRFRAYHDGYIDQTYKGWEEGFAKKVDYTVSLHAKSMTNTPEGAAAKDRLEQMRLDQAEELHERIEINNRIFIELDRLNPETFPKHDPNAAQDFHDLFAKVSRAYTQAGAKKGASAVQVLLYILTCGIDHGAWYIAQWVSACLALGYFAQAETILKLLGPDADEGKYIRGKFAKAVEFRALLPMSRSLIALNRDEDVAEALHFAKCAKKNCPEIPATHTLHRAVRLISHGANGATALDASALLTGGKFTATDRTPRLLSTAEGAYDDGN